MASINNVLVMDNRETPLKFVGRKKVPKGISKGNPTEQQKYYIFKNYTEPATLLKNQQQGSEVVKAIKEALGVKTVVENTSIVENFGFEDVGAQQKTIRDRRNIGRKIRKEREEFQKEQEKRNNASSLLKSAVARKKAQDKLLKAKPLYDEKDERAGYDLQSYFKGRPTNQEQKLKTKIEEEETRKC